MPLPFAADSFALSPSATSVLVSHSPTVLYPIDSQFSLGLFLHSQRGMAEGAVARMVKLEGPRSGRHCRHAEKPCIASVVEAIPGLALPAAYSVSEVNPTVGIVATEKPDFSRIPCVPPTR